MARPKRESHRTIAYRKRLISRKPKKKIIEIVSRKGQPQVFAEVKRLKKAQVGGPVASSWISDIIWDNNRNIALMRLLDGKFYDVFIKFELFEEWFFAHSKGTFFNSRIKDKHKVVRTF